MVLPTLGIIPRERHRSSAAGTISARPAVRSRSPKPILALQAGSFPSSTILALQAGSFPSMAILALQAGSFPSMAILALQAGSFPSSTIKALLARSFLRLAVATLHPGRGVPT